MSESPTRSVETNSGISSPHLQELFDETSRPFRTDLAPRTLAEDPRPRAPLSPRDAGLTLDQLCELVLRHLMLEPTQRGIDLCRKLRLAWPVLQPACRTLQRAGCLELSSGHLLPESAERITLTPIGREHARKSFDRDRYIGPAPVPFADYIRQCRLQAPTELQLPAGDVQVALADLCFDDETFDALGGAISSGGPLLLFGETGNGKTIIAKRLALAIHRMTAPICVPYAVLFEGAVMTVFDPQLHYPLAGDDDLSQTSRFPNEPSHESWNSIPDSRWRLVRRPKLLLSAELAQTRMQWTFPQPGHVAEAPWHVKANGGVCILDDLQRLPRELVARLELILDEHLDTVALDDGRTVTFPVELLLVACSRDRRVDSGLLRRFRSQVELPAPNTDQLASLCESLAHEAGFHLSLSDVKSLFETEFPLGRPFNFADPNNLLETLRGICRFREMEPSVSGELLKLAARRCWGISERRSA